MLNLFYESQIVIEFQNCILCFYLKTKVLQSETLKQTKGIKTFERVKLFEAKH